jgi:hypothetical protein
MPAIDVEINGPNVIAESERSGKARSLFGPGLVQMFHC